MEIIEGVKTKELRVLPDERGRLMEILRRDDVLFTQFGQVYITTAYPGVIKAWHAHRKQRDTITCIYGMVKLALFDMREKSSTKGLINEFFIGTHNPVLIHIPEEIWHGFKNIGETECIVINIPSEVYNYEDPDELRKPFNTSEIPYDWNSKDN